MKLIRREEWGARPPRRRTAIPDNPEGVTFHYEGPGMGQFDHSKCYAYVRSIQKYHMDTHGWDDIAYNAVVCYHGYVFEGRWSGVRSAANGTTTGNRTSYAICGLFGVGDPLTDEMKDAYLDVRTFFMNIPTSKRCGSTIRPHSYWKPTGCPGDPVRAWINAGCPDPIAEGAPTPVPTDPTPTDKAVSVSIFTDGVYTFASDGGVFTEGAAVYHGGLGGVALNAPIVWGEALPDHSGYYMLGADGGVFAFGPGAPSIPPYPPLMDEYAQKVRRVTTGELVRAGHIVAVSNFGERYDLAV